MPASRVCEIAPTRRSRSSAYSKQGVTQAQAASALTAMAAQLRALHREIPEGFLRVSVFPVDGIRAFEGMTRRLMPAFAFLGAITILSGLVLLVGCANIAGMLLGRASARRKAYLRHATRIGRGAWPRRASAAHGRASCSPSPGGRRMPARELAGRQFHRGLGVSTLRQGHGRANGRTGARIRARSDDVHCRRVWSGAGARSGAV